MKPARRVDSTSQSCSCTSCPYKSESEQLSIRKYIARGSRISRLYFGKYIPLRERKLLNRLVRTRAVYDDLRARLISDSTLSLDKKADLRPGRQHHVIKPVDSQKSGAILEIVDIIDKGANLDPKKISDCCSCCSCSSKSKIIERKKKEPRRKRAHGQEYEEEFSETKIIGTGEGGYARTYEQKYGTAGQIGPGEEVYARTYQKKYGKTGQAGTGEGMYARIHEKKYGKTGQAGTGHAGTEQAGTGEVIYAKTHEKKYGKTGQAGTGQIGTGEGFYETYEREFRKTSPGKMGERYNKRGVHFKAKRIRSDPCTCTLKFSGLIKKHSKAMFKKNQPLPEPFLDIEELNIVEKSKKKNLARRSLQKYNELRNKLDLSMKKLNESKANMKKNLQVRAKKSLEQVKEAKNKIKNNIESGVRKSMQAVKRLRPKEKAFEPVEYPEEETKFKIKKDSILKFKDYLKRKEMMKDWECNLKCEPDVCVPEDCFKIIKLRRLRKPSRQRDRKHGARYEMIQREVRVGGAPLSKSSSAVQTKQLAITTATHTKKHKPMINVEGKKQVMEKRLVLESKELKTEGMEKRGKKISEKSQAIHVIPAKHGESAARDIKKKRHVQRENEILKEREHIAKKPHSRGRQAVRIESSFSFDVEFYKKPRQTNTSRSSEPSGIHMHAPRRRRKKKHSRHESIVTSISSLASSQGTPENYKTSLVQTDKYVRPSITLQQRRVMSKTSQCECKTRLSNIKTNTITKSVSSATANVATIDRNTSQEVKQRGRLSQVSLLPPARPDALTSEINESYPQNKQAVRIGSTFSFSVEFYKKGAQNEIPPLQTPFITEKVKLTRSKNRQVGTKLVKTRSKNRQAGRRLVQVKGTSAKAYNDAKNTLRRCFCTLKLHGQAKNKKKTKITKKKQNSDKKSETEPQLPYMIDKNVETKKYRYEPPKLHRNLLPYECEPGICIPDECDPMVCKKYIDLRKRRHRRRINKSIGSYTGSRKTKSTSSIMSRSLASARAKTVQSSIVPTRVGYTNAPKRYKNYEQDVVRNEFITTNISASERQAVRIGSSFSFNIEFYKNKPTPVVEAIAEPSLTSIAPDINYNQMKFKRGGHKKRNKSIFTQVINVDKYVGPSLKRCLCTLKLYKNKNPKQKELKKATHMTVDTQTFGEVPVEELVNKGTRTKKEHRYKLLPYECEPYFCVPGECDPYLCLQRIKKRGFNTRNISAFTDEPEMRSVSSLTENSLTKSEAILVQPKLFRKGTNMKADYVKVLDNTPKPAREIFKAADSKQAVRIGSSFNFNIEFSKKLPGEVKLTKYPKLKESSIDRSKTNRGITVTKVRIGHTDTQALQPRKVNRASAVRPMLKRCFCTLNLQKKTKQQFPKNKQETKYFGPEYYTVARATTAKAEIISHSFENLQLIEPKHKIISISTSSFLLHKFAKSIKSKSETLKLWSSLKIPFKEAVFINSNLSMKLDIVRQLGPSKESIARYMKQPLQTFGHALIEEKTCECLKVFNETSKQNVKKVSGFSQYLNQCFCTMNVQISNPREKKNKTYKLKPYECEPGVCIPGDCNPYECKKLIMKRFARNVHKGSATDLRSVSSNATSTARLDSRNNHIQTRVRNRSRVTIPQKYKQLRLGEKQRQAIQLGESKQRQAVRIKSSFSFDLEFYKHRPQPTEKYVTYDEPIKNSVRQITYGTPERGTQVLKKKNNRDTGFQSAVGFVHKGTAPMKKRCFCTLKLQKKGRIPREYAKMNNIQAKEPSITSRNIKIGTNIKNQKIPIDPYDLKRYECEPGICVPGQCDPYKCLELMKHRKHLGINTNQKDTISFGSMTSEEKYKARAVGRLPLKKHHKSTKTVRYITSNEKVNPQILGQSSRQAVRIGSNFSFNIEFYKGTPQLQTYTHANLQKRIIPRSDSRVLQELKVRKDETGDRKDVIISPKKKNVSHRAIVTEKPLNQEAAITASLKRCFCTKNLHSVKFLDQQKKKSFKDKCSCLLGLHSKGKKKDQATEQLQTQAQPVKKLVHTAEKPTNTNVKHKVHLSNLEPYECEPGICIPGQCDPYLCDKIIQQRLAKQISKKSETETVHSQSVSSGVGNYKLSKNQRTQAQYQKNQKQIQHRSKNSTPSGKVISNSDKRLVRIGSNFSFNIEFYKENVNGSPMKERVKEVRTSPTKDIQYGRVATGPTTGMTGMDSKNIATETAGVRHNKAQIKIGPLLKRCFCTLKLKNKPNDQINRIKKGKQLDTKPAIQMKSVETQSHKRFNQLQNDIDGEILLPYECEPNVCIPGQCDPEECLKRIKRRQQHTKEFGTITKYPKTKSIGNVGTRMRNEKFQVQYPQALPNKGVQKTSVDISGPATSNNQQRQAVRIGSNFSFNIEFFKDIDNGLPKVVTDGPLEEFNRKKYIKKSSQLHTSTQPSYLMRDVDSQVISPKLQSTETAMAHLKRCFCTLPLRNKKLARQENIKIQSDQPKSDHSSIGNFLKKCVCTLKFHKLGKQNQTPPTAVKYEIKGTSTHNPRAQKYRVQKPARILEPYECEPYTCIPGECDPYECLKRIQRRQVRDCGTGYKRNLKDSATDSIKQPVTRSTKVQYYRKGKLNSKGTSSLPSKYTRNSKEMAPISYQPSYNPNRQVVRIGSNFSFNVEFFKDHGTGNTVYKDNRDSRAAKQITLNQQRRPGTKSISTGKRRVCNRISQCTGPKKRVTLSATDIAPQRCFCTLKLLKKPNHPRSEGKLLPPTLKTKDKMTATKIKYAAPQELGVYECPPLMCIPGECNPYECLEKIKRREAIQKSRNVGTRAPRTTVAAVGNRSLNLRARKIQSQVAKKRNIIASTPYSEPQSEILKSSRNIEHSNRRNKRAVRIGSNFNFNVEFFKQKMQPAAVTVPQIGKTRDYEEDLRSYVNKNTNKITAGAKNFRHTQMDGIKLKDQASDARNLLKRCFCTLQLQKPRNQKMGGVKMHLPKNKPRYPQTFVVGRVAVEPYFNTNTKINQSKKKDKARSTSTNAKLCNKTRGTKMDKKYLKNSEFPPSQCNPKNCPDYNKRFLKGNDMQTILPFTPSRFYKKQSKTLVGTNNELDRNHATGLRGEITNKPTDASMLTKGRRRLTAKKSNKSIPKNSLEIKSNVKDSFFGRCAKFFCRRLESFEGSDNRPKPSKIICQSEKIKLTIPPKRARSIDRNCPFTCPDNTTETRKRFSKLHAEDVGNSETKALRKSIFNNNQSKGRYGGEKCVTFADTAEHLKNNSRKRKTIKYKSGTRSSICYSCSVNDCPFKNQKISGDFEKREKSMKAKKKAPSYSESADDCQFCVCCKRQIDTDEISKGGGDRRSTKSSRLKEDTGSCPCGKKSTNNGAKVNGKNISDKRSRKFTMTKDKSCRKIKPLLELQLDCVSHTIINKSEVEKKLDDLGISKKQVEGAKSKKMSDHHDLCSCCICLRKHGPLGKLKGAAISVGAKGAKDGKSGKKTKDNIVLTKPPKKIPPCICGSKKCATASKINKSDKSDKGKVRFTKTCICGSKICASESRIMKQKKKNKIHTAKNKAQLLIEKIERKELLRRAKIEDDKDEIRRQKRITRNKQLEKRVKKYKNASDLMLAIDSLGDIGKLGLSSAYGAARYTTKALFDPKVACERLCRKCRKKDPETMLKQLEQDYMESDAASTMRRLKTRCLYMKRVQSIKETLENNPISHFIMHIADKNPKTRIFKRKPVRHVREPVDFQCSLYMATLRKRPYLSVYYKWPWFYPHFITMLNIWRQFTDIMLFLLAAVVWSPCILCMEGCRALMCCFFCTG